jgi:hypothetical protein
VLLALLGAFAPAVPAFAQYHYYPDYQTSGDYADQLVRSWYRKFFDREVDPGYRGWVDAIRQGQNPTQILSSILGSSEFLDKSGNSLEGFVQNLFISLAGRPPNPQEFAYWMDQARYRDRSDIAYALLTRYPQAWQSSPPQGYRYGAEYEYRRPAWRYHEQDWWRPRR